MELADKMILMSKFCKSSSVGGKENDEGEVEVEWEHDGVSGMGRVNRGIEIEELVLEWKTKGKGWERMMGG